MAHLLRRPPSTLKHKSELLNTFLSTSTKVMSGKWIQVERKKSEICVWYRLSYMCSLYFSCVSKKFFAYIWVNTSVWDTFLRSPCNTSLCEFRAVSLSTHTDGKMFLQNGSVTIDSSLMIIFFNYNEKIRAWSPPSFAQCQWLFPVYIEVAL